MLETMHIRMLPCMQNAIIYMQNAIIYWSVYEYNNNCDLKCFFLIYKNNIILFIKNYFLHYT